MDVLEDKHHSHKQNLFAQIALNAMVDTLTSILDVVSMLMFLMRIKYGIILFNKLDYSMLKTRFAIISPKLQIAFFKSSIPDCTSLLYNFIDQCKKATSLTSATNKQPIPLSDHTSTKRMST